jgi:predicted CopG family antitoxin
MIKTIKIKEDTHKMLCDYGNKNESFDLIIKRLIIENKRKNALLKNENN